jgi:hypothetical protein
VVLLSITLVEVVEAEQLKERLTVLAEQAEVAQDNQTTAELVEHLARLILEAEVVALQTTLAVQAEMADLE